MIVQSIGIPRINNYEDALKHHDAVVPFRSGRKKGARPLGSNRRYKWCLIHKTEETGVVSMEFCGKDLADYYPNGEIHIHGDQTTWVSTRQFVAEVLPRNIVTEYRKGRFYIGVRSEGIDWYHLPINHTLILKDNKILNPVGETIYKLNLAKFREVKAKHGAFRDYIKNIGLINTQITEDEVNKVAQVIGEPDPRMPIFKGAPDPTPYRLMPLNLPTEQRHTHANLYSNTPLVQLRGFLADVDKAMRDNDLERAYCHYVHLGLSCLSYDYRTESYLPNRWGWSGMKEDNRETVGPKMLKYFDEILKHIYKEEVFTKAQLPHGKKALNDNRKYFE